MWHDYGRGTELLGGEYFQCKKRTTRLAERGKNAEVIRKLLGHRSLATTMKYIHMSDPALAENILDGNPQLWEVDPTGT